MNLRYWIAKKYLKGRKSNKLLSGITLISILGIVVGVMTLTVVLSVMEGFENDLKNKILGVNSDIIVQNRFGYGIENAEKIEQKIKNIKGVVASAPFLLADALIVSKGRNYTVMLRGIDEKKENKVTSYGKIVKKGRLKSHGIVIGSELARMLNVEIGDKVRILVPNGKITPIGILPRVRDFKISGIFDSGMYEYDTSLVYMKLDELFHFLSKKGADGIGIKIKKTNDAVKIAKNIEKILPEQFVAKDWYRMNKNLYSAMELERKTMFIILTLIILVASFNIVATLITMVREKRKEIGILRSLGFNRQDVKKIFLYNGLIVGTTGIVIGELLGLLICLIIKVAHINVLPADVYYSTELKVDISFFNFMIVGVVAFLITYLASVFPANQAAKMDIVEAIKYE